MQHRLSMVVGGVLAVAVGALLIVLGSADDAAGRGEPAPPVGDGEGGVGLEEVGDGEFEAPVNVAFAPGHPANTYVVEQDGTVEVLVDNNEVGVFLDIGDLTNASGEQGLLGLTFHPNFESNGLVYAYYTAASNDDIVVSEFNATATDADESSRRQVIRIRHRMATNHNGGQLLFGPDGFLYMATGDGGSGGDPGENAQDRRSLLGKLLRINPLDPPGPKSYRSPKGNPYKGAKGRDEIFARGLRNPFRFTFDEQTKRIAIGDVGQSDFEEVHYEGPKTLRKANFGWDRWEGVKRYRDPDDNESRRPKAKHHDRPIHVYDHGQGRAITGGVVVRDTDLTNLYGRYLYADFFEPGLRSFIPRLEGAQDDKPLGTEFRQTTSFTTSPFTNEVFVTSLGGDVRFLEPIPPSP